MSGRQRGFALLIVLWTMVLLALLVTQLTAAGRSEAQLTANLRGAAIAEAAADGAVQEAVFHLLDTSPRHWFADGSPHPLRLPGASAVVRLDNQAGLVNPNAASLALLTALLAASGADGQTAAHVAAAILAWRMPAGQGPPDGAGLAAYRAAGRDYGPPGAAFQSLDELGRVLGMTPALLAALRPHLSLDHDRDPDPPAADPVVAQALASVTGLMPQPGLSRDETAVAITATAAGPGHARFTRRAVVRLGAGTSGAPFQVMEWTTPATEQ